MMRLFCIVLFATSLRAADVEVGAQHVLMPSSESNTLTLEMARGFGAHAEVFWRDSLSTRFAATFLNPAAILFPENPPPSDVDLGTLGLDIYSATARYHVGGRWSGFAGGGAALVDIGNLDDQFGDDVELEFSREVAFVAEGGLRYRFRPSVVFELGVTYIPLEAEPDVLRANDPRYPLPSVVKIDPLVVSAGAAWRF